MRRSGLPLTLALSLLPFTLATQAHGEEQATFFQRDNTDQTWGVSAQYRIATVPFAVGEKKETTSSFVPLIHFENDYFYIDGFDAGYKAYSLGAWRFDIMSRLRLIDLPEDLQHEYGSAKLDMGAELTYQLTQATHTKLNILSDAEGRAQANWQVATEYSNQDWWFKPSVTLRYKSADFNSHYYAVEDFTNQRIGAGVDANIGIEGRYHVFSNLYFMGSTSLTILDHNAYNADAIDSNAQGEIYLGFGLFNQPERTKRSDVKAKPYWRIAHGWGTLSNLGEIIRFQTEKDEFNNQMTSIFYGHPLSDTLFGFPIEIYLTPGIGRHWSSEVQGASTEYIAAIKAYYTFEWPFRWRFGVAEGLSWVDRTTYLEYQDMIVEKDQYTTASRLLNYLDFSFDFSLGDAFDRPEWKDVWLGYTIHHRSAIFEASAQYGRMKGGSNYNMVYLQYHF
ncbi:MipA/OmpV family protein [Vibrio sp. WXL210]|uniref:MipA/OmpV family protein n=1 Tax=Vibrio sp. WXL210 TaxID=3450709 RepID=UPI003EC75585